MSKTENTQENKARFFALYLGSRFTVTDMAELKDREIFITYEFTVHASNIGGSIFDDDYEMDIIVDACCLSLRSIESLTESECRHIAELAKLEWTTNNEFYDLMVSKGSFGTYMLDVRPLYFKEAISIIDYLRSISILIPWMGLSVSKILDYGWAKIKED